ncbi:MAG TPA: hypothetical protein VGR28_09360 [Candidatus Thermoplasmatota archaeon]|jgi:hypothetical protein|nr:hypothetical protein [Candidatus Thermoplasmatota archaeon]
MRTLLALVIAAVAFAGCVNQATPDADLAAATAPAAMPAPQTVDWKGHIVTSEGEMLAHGSTFEPLVAPLYKEGFLFDITEVPQLLRVDLDWSGSAQLMIMLHAPHGKDGYREYITDMSADKPLCLMVGPEELSTGKWQIMTHSDGAMNTEFTLTVTTWGGHGEIVPDAPHGHALDEQFNIEQGEGLTCPAA